eukprot:Rmarinus@m.10718
MNYEELYRRFPDTSEISFAVLDSKFTCEELRRILVENGIRYTHADQNHRHFSKTEMINSLLEKVHSGEGIDKPSRVLSYERFAPRPGMNSGMPVPAPGMVTGANGSPEAGGRSPTRMGVGVGSSVGSGIARAGIDYDVGIGPPPTSAAFTQPLYGARAGSKRKEMDIDGYDYMSSAKKARYSTVGGSGGSATSLEEASQAAVARYRRDPDPRAQDYRRHTSSAAPASVPNRSWNSPHGVSGTSVSPPIPSMSSPSELQLLREELYNFRESLRHSLMNMWQFNHLMEARLHDLHRRLLYVEQCMEYSRLPAGSGSYARAAPSPSPSPTVYPRAAAADEFEQFPRSASSVRSSEATSSAGPPGSIHSAHSYGAVSAPTSVSHKNNSIPPSLPSPRTSHRSMPPSTSPGATHRAMHPRTSSQYSQAPISSHHTLPYTTNSQSHSHSHPQPLHSSRKLTSHGGGAGGPSSHQSSAYSSTVNGGAISSHWSSQPASQPAPQPGRALSNSMPSWGNGAVGSSSPHYGKSGGNSNNGGGGGGGGCESSGSRNRDLGGGYAGGKSVRNDSGGRSSKNSCGEHIDSRLVGEHDNRPDSSCADAPGEGSVGASHSDNYSGGHVNDSNNEEHRNDALDGRGHSKADEKAGACGQENSSVASSSPDANGGAQSPPTLAPPPAATSSSGSTTPTQQQQAPKARTTSKSPS